MKCLLRGSWAIFCLKIRNIYLNEAHSTSLTPSGTPNEKIWPGYSDLPATQRVSFVNHPYNKIGNRFPQSILSQEVCR